MFSLGSGAHKLDQAGWLMGPSRYPLSTPLLLELEAHAIILCGYWGLNSGIHTCVASTCYYLSRKIIGLTVTRDTVNGRTGLWGK